VNGGPFTYAPAVQVFSTAAGAGRVKRIIDNARGLGVGLGRALWDSPLPPQQRSRRAVLSPTARRGHTFALAVKYTQETAGRVCG
jgi:hypothetical protein